MLCPAAWLFATLLRLEEVSQCHHAPEVSRGSGCQAHTNKRVGVRHFCATHNRCLLHAHGKHDAIMNTMHCYGWCCTYVYQKQNSCCLAPGTRQIRQCNCEANIRMHVQKSRTSGDAPSLTRSAVRRRELDDDAAMCKAVLPSSSRAFKSACFLRTCRRYACISSISSVSCTALQYGKLLLQSSSCAFKKPPV